MTPQNQTKTIALLGATGGTGRAFLDEALSRGHRVRALVREGSTLEARSGLTVIRGDATDRSALLELVRGVDATVIALGAPAFSKSRVRSEGTAALRDVLPTGARVVCVSVLGAHESKPMLPLLYRAIIFPLYLRRVVADHEVQETILRESDLDVTLVRPPNLHDGPARRAFAHGLDALKGTTMNVSRADLAVFMADELESGRYAGGAVILSDTKAVASAA